MFRAEPALYALLSDGQHHKCKPCLNGLHQADYSHLSLLMGICRSQCIRYIEVAAEGTGLPLLKL